MSADLPDNAHSLHGKQIENLFDRYYSRLCYYAYSIIQDTESAKDIVQDVFFKCLKSLTDIDNEAASKNLLYLSVRNACFNHLRHKGIKEQYAASLLEHPVEVSEKGLDEIVRAEVIAEIRKAIDMLPEGCKMVIKLSFLEGLNNEEIAENMGISINTVKSQKQRALKLLRLKLDINAYTLLLILLP